jgi:predicted AAA+ superfamily ATPase
MQDAEKLLARAHGLLDRVERLLPGGVTEPPTGDCRAWRWQSQGLARSLAPVKTVSGVRLNDLQCIDQQKAEIMRNTRQFLRKLPANHVLLWGPRGTGKSSLIKALLNEYRIEGLCLIEVEKQHLTDLALITGQLSGLPRRFIIYCDDLSFDAHDPSYRAIKVIIDGSISATPENVLIYATSNRRHLLPEYMSDNLQGRMIDGEVHQSESVEEKISLSERFGLWLAFHPFNQEQYLSIVDYWIKKLKAPGHDRSNMHEQALQWALSHGSRSGRSAWQFACDWTGRHRLK